jgi:hypothetical protein
MRFVFALLAAFVLSAASQQAYATTAVSGESGEAFASPTFRELSQMLVMMDGIDINDPAVADDYAKLLYCGLYKDKFKNDFEWNKVRQQLINRVVSKKDYYRTQFELAGSINLDRYNFETQDFPLTPATEMVRVGSMILYDVTNEPDPRLRVLCRDESVTRVFPGHYLFVLAQPLTFDRLKLPMEEAKALLERMNSTKNKDRRLFVRFRLRITGIDKVLKTRAENVQVMLKGEMTNIDIFHDAELTKLLTSINLTK